MGFTWVGSSCSSTFAQSLLLNCYQVGKMAPQVKAFAAERNKLSSILKVHVVRRKLTSTSCSMVTCACTHMHTV